MLDGSVPMSFGSSLMLSGIGILMVFFELALIALLINIVSKGIRSAEGKANKKPSAPETSVQEQKSEPKTEEAPANTGLTLTDVDEPTAAAIMAIVSSELNIPLNHLNFKSIKGIVELEGVEERDAAVIMALTAHKLGKPLNRLNFKSIKKI